MVSKKSLQIAVVSPRYGLVGGSEFFAMELTERLASNPDFSIHVFANQWRSVSDNITFHRFPIIKFPRFLRPLSTAVSVNRKIAQQQFDIIHTHERVLLADIYSIHGLPHQYWIKNVRKKKRMSLFDYCTHWVENKMVMHPRCCHLLPVSKSTRDIFCQTFNVMSKNIQVIHPGVNNQQFEKYDRQACRKEIRERLGLNLSDIVILFVGMNFEIKGLKSLMGAVAKTIQNKPEMPLKLVVIGKGNYDYYNHLASQMTIQDHVVFAGVVHDEIEKMYLASDMFSMLSEFDTFGMTVLEAMAAGLPVIVSDGVGAKDIVVHGTNGYISERNQLNQYSACIEKLLNENHRESVSKAAYQTALDHTWDHTAEQVARIYGNYRANSL